MKRDTGKGLGSEGESIFGALQTQLGLCSLRAGLAAGWHCLSCSHGGGLAKPGAPGGSGAWAEPGTASPGTASPVTSTEHSGAAAGPGRFPLTLVLPDMRRTSMRSCRDDLNNLESQIHLGWKYLQDHPVQLLPHQCQLQH